MNHTEIRNRLAHVSQRNGLYGDLEHHYINDITTLLAEIDSVYKKYNDSLIHATNAEQYLSKQLNTLQSQLEQARECLITVHDKLCADGHTLTYCVDVIMQIRDFLEEKE